MVARFLQGFGCHLADTPQAAQRQGRQYLTFRPIGDPDQAIRFAKVRRQFGQELIGRNASRGDEARRPPYLFLDGLAYVDDIRIMAFHPGDIEESLI